MGTLLRLVATSGLGCRVFSVSVQEETTFSNLNMYIDRIHRADERARPVVPRTNTSAAVPSGVSLVLVVAYWRPLGLLDVGPRLAVAWVLVEKQIWSGIGDGESQA